MVDIRIFQNPSYAHEFADRVLASLPRLSSDCISSLLHYLVTYGEVPDALFPSLSVDDLFVAIFYELNCRVLHDREHKYRDHGHMEWVVALYLAYQKMIPYAGQLPTILVLDKRIEDSLKAMQYVLTLSSVKDVNKVNNVEFDNIVSQVGTSHFDEVLASANCSSTRWMYKMSAEYFAAEKNAAAKRFEAETEMARLRKEIARVEAILRVQNENMSKRKVGQINSHARDVKKSRIEVH